MIVEDLRYPIGRFKAVRDLSASDRKTLIAQIAAAPNEVRKAVAGMNDVQLDTPYRDGGWTVRQVVHHLADSHMNAYIRFKLAVTEEHPTIKPYDETAWARLPEAAGAPVDISLDLLESLHRRWVMFLDDLKPEDFRRTVNHPENGTMTLETILQLYAWHGRHHVAHITSLRKRKGW
ncbi:MAG: putative metal-dependent hydrolase [Bacteroidia bacterium]|nr:MAG: putative metal-dependent hydrolase [Bacteroidia bacterium]